MRTSIGRKGATSQGSVRIPGKRHSPRGIIDGREDDPDQALTLGQNLMNHHNPASSDVHISDDGMGSFGQSEGNPGGPFAGSLFCVRSASIGSSRIAVALALCVLALTGCASDELSKRCSEAIARADCPPGTAARVESEYHQDILGIDERRCLAMGPVGSDAYLRCRDDLSRDRGELGPLQE
jgi:hypothetical protein